MCKPTNFSWAALVPLVRVSRGGAATGPHLIAPEKINDEPALFRGPAASFVYNPFSQQHPSRRIMAFLTDIAAFIDGRVYLVRQSTQIGITVKQNAVDS